MADDSQGGTTPPTTRIEDPPREPRELIVSLWIEVAPVGDLLANGREVGAYIWGYWNRHLREIPDGWKGTIELVAEVRREHLAAAITTLVQAGANAAIHTDGGERVAVRFFVDIA